MGKVIRPVSWHNRPDHDLIEERRKRGSALWNYWEARRATPFKWDGAVPPSAA